MGLRLGFHYHIPAIQKGGQIWMPGYLGRFIDSLAEKFDSIVCFMHTPLPGEEQLMDYPLRSKNVKLIGLGSHSSLPHRVLHARELIKIVRASRNQIDALLIRGPSPLLPWLAKACKPAPTILLLVGDLLAGVDDLPQPLWRKEAIRAFWKWYSYQQVRVAKRSLTFVNSRLLYNQLDGKVDNLVETRTTTLGKTDFFVREDTCLSHPFHLLYTGRMDPAKGLLDMVMAVSFLVSQGEDVILDLVGWVEEGSTILQDIHQLASKNKVVDRVFYHGSRPVGPDLFDFYKKADIYLIASKSSFEGFPRTIWEAMAHSLPVVATRVGSVPDFIDHEAELVEPNNPIELAKGISRVIHSLEKRRQYISKGLTLARQNSLENQVGEMAREIKNWVPREHE